MSEQGENRSYWPGLVDRTLVYGGLAMILVQSIWMAAAPSDTLMTTAGPQLVAVIFGLASLALATLLIFWRSRFARWAPRLLAASALLGRLGMGGNIPSGKHSISPEAAS